MEISEDVVTKLREASKLFPDSEMGKLLMDAANYLEYYMTDDMDEVDE